MINKISLLLIVGWLFLACTPIPKKQESAFIVIKTPTMKYADLGFVSSSINTLEVEIYAAGQPLMDFEINGLNVCMSTFECMDKKSFNEKILSATYPDEILENIFRSKPIFNSKNLVQDKEGIFTQKLKKEGLYDISYSVDTKQRIFRDKINKILIKVREQ
jgi:hypothetical protein